jgi:aminoglycoside 6-adenylyltransferase
MLDGIVRFENLLPLLGWYIGANHGWNVAVGTHGHWLRRHLDKEDWEEYSQTFADSRMESNWSALAVTVNLARRIATAAATKLGYVYPIRLDRKVTTFIENIRTLPRDP